MKEIFQIKKKKKKGFLKINQWNENFTEYWPGFNFWEETPVVIGPSDLYVVISGSGPFSVSSNFCTFPGENIREVIILLNILITNPQWKG